MDNQLINFVKGQRLSPKSAKVQEARGNNVANLHELRMQGIQVPNKYTLTGTEFRALNLTDSDVNNFNAVAAPAQGVFQWMKDVRDERFLAIGYLDGQEAVQELNEGEAFDNTNAGAADIWSVVKSDAVKRYHKQFQISGHLIAHTEGIAEALVAEAKGAIAEAIDADALVALAAASAATGSAFAAEDVIEQFGKYDGNYNFVGTAAQVLDIRKQMKDAGMEQFIGKVNMGAAAGYGWVDGKAALYLPQMDILRNEYTLAAEGELLIEGQALAQLVAVDVDKFAAS